MILILLSTYNGERYLLDFLSSLITQTDKNWKLLVRDDGSSDQTVKVLSQFEKQNPSQVEIIIDDINVGAKRSFGKLISLALNDLNWTYLMFADQDDVWMEDKVSLTRSMMDTMNEKFGRTTPLLVHSDLNVVDSSLNLLAESFWIYQHVDPMRDKLNNQIVQNIVTGCTAMINRPLATLCVPIPDEAIMHDWWISLTASAFGHIGIVNQPTIHYRQHDANDTGAKSYTWKYIYQRFFIRQNLDKYFVQAEIFSKHYASHLSEPQQDMLQKLSGWSEAGFWRRRWLIIRYRLWKKGFIRNIGIMVFA